MHASLAFPNSTSNLRQDGFDRWFVPIVGELAGLPLVSGRASCGAPDIVDGDIDEEIDFHAFLVANPGATFGVQIAGRSMIGAGLFPGDIAIVDRSRQALNGDVVMAWLLDGSGFTIKRYRRKGRNTWLAAENPAFADLEPVTGFEVWGVISRSIRVLR